jgi:hypothetical protein
VITNFMGRKQKKTQRFALRQARRFGEMPPPAQGGEVQVTRGEEQKPAPRYLGEAA